MTYFELFDIPVQLKIEPSALAGRFFSLSRQFHPDFFAREDAAAQSEALEKSALLNKAWKTFQNQDETIKYVLQIKGLMQDDEKYELPPAFLMEVMDINEQLMDMETGGDKSIMESDINNLQSAIYEPVKEIMESYKEGTTTEKELLQVKEYYYKKKYLDRLRREIATK